jgi:Flp pilus assembly protein CpaB
VPPVPHWPRTARDPGWAPLRRHHPGRRRLAAAGLVAGALATGLQALAPRPPAGAPVLVAVRDVAAGAVLGASDLQVVRRTASELPQGALADPSLAVGRAVGSGMRSGEPLTDARLVGPGLLAGRPHGEVASPVRIADGEAAALLRPGDRVDVLQATAGDGPGSPAAATGRNPSAGAAGGAARTVVRHATVLARPGGAGTGGGLLPEADPSAGGLLVLAVEEDEAADLAEAAARGPLSVVLRASG